MVVIVQMDLLRLDPYVVVCSLKLFVLLVSGMLWPELRVGSAGVG